MARQEIVNYCAIVALVLAPHLQQRLISLSVGVNLSNRDAFTPHAHVMAGVNILALANFFPEN